LRHNVEAGTVLEASRYQLFQITHVITKNVTDLDSMVTELFIQWTIRIIAGLFMPFISIISGA